MTDADEKFFAVADDYAREWAADRRAGSVPAGYYHRPALLEAAREWASSQAIVCAMHDSQAPRPRLLEAEAALGRVYLRWLEDDGDNRAFAGEVAVNELEALRNLEQK